MQVTNDVYLLRSSSSVELHSKAVEAMRRLYFTKFKLIVLQHLSKALHIKPYLLKRPYIIINYRARDDNVKKYKYFLASDDGVSDGSFGGLVDFFLTPPVGTETIKEYAADGKTVVHFTIGKSIRSLRDFLTKENNARTVGIFLKSGSRDAIYELRERLKSNESINFEKERYSVHDCANLLKLYLQQMDQPIFISNYYAAYERISELEQLYTQLEYFRLKQKSRATIIGRLIPPNSELKYRKMIITNSIQLIVQLMPKKKIEFFGYIVDILESVYANSAYNRMGASSLGTIFAPLLACPRTLPRDVKLGTTKQMSYMISRIIKLGRHIFDAPMELVTEVWESTRDIRDQIDFGKLLVLQKFGNNSK